MNPPPNATATTAAPVASRVPPSEPLLRRIRAEFIEMPGMRLTMRQAQRLWGLEATTCAAMLQQLVDARFLTTDGEWYARRADGDLSVHASH